MEIVVQKYGGTSVGDAEKIRNVARRVAKTKDAGNQVVVVVSAMGDSTDELIHLANQVTDHPSTREMDMILSTGEIISASLLAMALQHMGYKAISLSGRQAGIFTDHEYSKARIAKIESQRILDEFHKGNIVIVAGFQGISDEEDITTLGRGGSDTTAVALAISLGAKRTERYTDVDGVYTADPRICPEARKLKDISYDEMLELATCGSKMMHYRAVELAGVHDMPILVASSFTSEPGTLIHGGVTMEFRNKVRGIAHDTDVAKITLTRIPDRPGIAAAIFEPLAAAGISVDTIVQNASSERITDLTFTVATGDIAKAREVIESAAVDVEPRDIITNDNLGKVSIVGIGMQNTPGYAAKMFTTLSKAGINILLITTSEIRITCIIEADKVNEAVRVLHKTFEMESENGES